MCFRQIDKIRQNQKLQFFQALFSRRFGVARRAAVIWWSCAPSSVLHLCRSAAVIWWGENYRAGIGVAKPAENIAGGYSGPGKIFGVRENIRGGGLGYSAD